MMMSEQRFMGHGYYAGMEAMYSKRINELMAENQKLRECINLWIDAERLRQEGKPIPMDWLGKKTKEALSQKE